MEAPRTVELYASIGFAAVSLANRLVHDDALGDFAGTVVTTADLGLTFILSVLQHPLPARTPLIQSMDPLIPDAHKAVLFHVLMISAGFVIAGSAKDLSAANFSTVYARYRALCGTLGVEPDPTVFQLLTADMAAHSSNLRATTNIQVLLFSAAEEYRHVVAHPPEDGIGARRQNTQADAISDTIRMVNAWAGATVIDYTTKFVEASNSVALVIPAIAKEAAQFQAELRHIQLGSGYQARLWPYLQIVQKDAYRQLKRFNNLIAASTKWARATNITTANYTPGNLPTTVPSALLDKAVGLTVRTDPRADREWLEAVAQLGLSPEGALAALRKLE